MKSLLLTGLVLSSIFAIAGCNTQPNPNINQTQQNKLPEIVTSFYPLYEIAKTVGGNFVSVKNLVPAGTEPHDYAPTAQDVISMHNADLVIYNGAGLEPWSEKIIPELEKAGIKTVNESAGVDIMNDPHIWLDPIKYAGEVENVQKVLIAIDPAHAENYIANATKFIAELKNLDQLYQSGLKDCKFNSFVTNHAAFSYLAKRYGLEMIAIAGVTPDAEPSAKTMVDLTKLIREKGIRYILVETLVSSKIANVLADEVGIKTLLMNPLEGLTDEEIRQGENYISIMKANLKSLQLALECK